MIEEKVVEIVDEEIDMLDQVEDDETEEEEEEEKPTVQKRVRPGGSVKKAKETVKKTNAKRKEKMAKKATKGPVKKVAKDVSKKLPRGGTTTATKVGRPRANRNDDGSPDNVVDTLKYLAKHPAAERTVIREATGIENLGLPWLVSEGHVKESVVEGQRARQFSITAKGKKYLTKGK